MIIEIMNKEQARFYIAQIIGILCYLRSKNVVHRDLKPGNFLFNETWHLVLADFGTAKEIESNQGSIIRGNSESNSKSFSSMTTRNSSANNLVKSNVSALSDNSSNAPKENIDDLFTSKPDFSQEEP